MSQINIIKWIKGGKKENRQKNGRKKLKDHRFERKRRMRSFIFSRLGYWLGLRFLLEKLRSFSFFSRSKDANPQVLWSIERSPDSSLWWICDRVHSSFSSSFMIIQSNYYHCLYDWIVIVLLVSNAITNSGVFTG